MNVSEARLAANRANALKSTGPKSAEGKTASRRNGLVHGLTGEGLVVPEADAPEVARRAEDLMGEFDPKSPLGQLMIPRLALLSVRMERAASRELLAAEGRARRAGDDFDEARHAEVDRLIGALADDPRAALRKLKKMPEGVIRLVEEWTDLRADLGRSQWGPDHLEKMAGMAGIKPSVARDKALGALAMAAWGDFSALTKSEGAGLEGDARRDWARAQVRARIDAEAAELQECFAAIDLHAIALDRQDAPALSWFVGSKQEILARRYESEASRGFFQALKELRRAEEEFAASEEAVRSAEMPARMGSSRQVAPPEAYGPPRGGLSASESSSVASRRVDGSISGASRPS